MAEKMTDDRLVAMLDHGIGQAVGFSESKLAKEREKVLRYYDGELPARASAGDSPYVSMDVWDGVEAMKSQLLELFSANGRPLAFKPEHGEDQDAANVRTDYVTHVLFDQNRGFSILRDAIDDALKGRVGVLKAWWDEKIDVQEYTMRDTSAEELTAHLTDNPDVEIVSLEKAEDGVGLKKVDLKLKVTTSQVKLRVMPPEEFGISPLAEDIETAELVFERRLLTISELRKMGYKKELLEDLQDNDRIWSELSLDKLQRFADTDDIMGNDDLLDQGMKSRRRCKVDECYLEVDMTGDGVSELWKVTKVGDTILDKERVQRKPFLAFAPMPRAHTFWGTNYAKLLVPIQSARTYLTRSIINHTLTTNNPRLQVVRGSVLNPRELIENRIGGIVNVTRPDGIIPLPQAGLNPFVFQTIAMLDADKEQVTGISKLSQGLNKDAISNQNSQAMVNDLINVSQTRQKVIARNFVENFLRDLYTALYRLIVENEDKAKIAQISGQWQTVNFAEWPEDVRCEVDPELGYNAQQKAASKWLIVDKYLNSDPEIKQFYPKEKRFSVIKKAMEASGIKDVTNYILTPDQIQPPPPDPMVQADLAVKHADAQVKVANAQAAVMKLKLDEKALMSKTAEHIQKLQQSNDHQDSKDAIERDKLNHKIAVDAAELRLSQEALAVDKLTAVAQPTRS